MTPVGPTRVRDLFLLATEIPSMERHAYLNTACGEDIDLRAAVERLLAAHADPASIVKPGIGMPGGAVAPQEAG
jgi:hypothetical protein